MKKFIDRMESAQSEGNVVTEKAASSGGKKKWGIGGMVRRVTGGGTPAPAVEGKEKEEGEPEGVQVDFYLVIVSCRCEFSSHLHIEIRLSS